VYLREFDPWGFPLCTCPKKYSVDPYTGCAHGCIYCYASSYIKDFRNPRPKRDFLRVFEREVRKKKGEIAYVSMSNSSDPYQPLEKTHRLTRGALQILKKYDVPVLLLTKSNLVLRDIDILKEMKVAVSITITTLDEQLASKLEPFAPPPTDRIYALKTLAKEGISTIARIDPLIPFINLDVEELIREVKNAGVKHVVFSTYKAKKDNFSRVASEFPELKEKLKEIYYRKGESIRGIRYAPRKMRYEILRKATEIALEYGLTVGYCREGFSFPAPTCDGSYLIFERSN